MKTTHQFRVLFSMVLIVPILWWSCQKDLIEIADNDAVETTPRAVYANRTVNFNSWSHLAPYTAAKAASDFGNIIDYASVEQDRCLISNSTLRVKLLKNQHGGAGGVIAKIDVGNHSAYELTYSIRFHSAFDFAQEGGKLGWGFLIGDGNTGGDPAHDGNGGSYRLAWYVSSTGAYWLRPYVYYKDQPGTYGASWGKRYPASGNIQRGVWYTVKMFAQANTNSNFNGKIKFTINGTVVHEDNAFRWTTNHSKRMINHLSWTNFRGGGAGSRSATDGLIYYDNFELKNIYAVY